MVGPHGCGNFVSAAVRPLVLVALAQHRCSLHDQLGSFWVELTTHAAPSGNTSSLYSAVLLWSGGVLDLLRANATTLQGCQADNPARPASVDRHQTANNGGGFFDQARPIVRAPGQPVQSGLDLS